MRRPHPTTVTELAWTNPDKCGTAVIQAVETNGRSVFEDMVLRQDDPPLNWVVRRDDILVEDSDAPGQ